MAPNIRILCTVIWDRNSPLAGQFQPGKSIDPNAITILRDSLTKLGIPHPKVANMHIQARGVINFYWDTFAHSVSNQLVPLGFLSRAMIRKGAAHFHCTEDEAKFRTGSGSSGFEHVGFSHSA